MAFGQSDRLKLYSRKNSGFIELTRGHDKSRVLVYPDCNVAVVDDGNVGCTVFFLSWILEVTESYDEVKHLIEEVNNEKNDT